MKIKYNTLILLTLLTLTSCLTTPKVSDEDMIRDVFIQYTDASLELRVDDMVSYMSPTALEEFHNMFTPQGREYSTNGIEFLNKVFGRDSITDYDKTQFFIDFMTFINSNIPDIESIYASLVYDITDISIEDKSATVTYTLSMEGYNESVKAFLAKENGGWKFILQQDIANAVEKIEGVIFK